MLIETVGKILFKQNDINYFLKENENKIIHIRDWVSSVIENNETWKQPRVLTINALNNAANKYFEKKNNKLQMIEINEKDEKLIADLGDYYLVQMLTPESLDNESKQMQHCIGYGGYDHKLNDKNYQYLSLRDKYNKSHITLEVYFKKNYQFQGKQNKIPDKKYLEKILPWLIENKYKSIPWEQFDGYYDGEKWNQFEDIKIEENIDYILHVVNETDIYEILSEKFNAYSVIYKELYENDLIIRNGVVVNYNQNLFNKFDKNNLKEIMLYLSSYFDSNFYFPYRNTYIFYMKNKNEVFLIEEMFEKNISKLNFDFSLSINENNDIEYLPNNLKINGDFYLKNCEKLKKLPDLLIVNDSLSICNCPNLLNLPENMQITKDIFLNEVNIDKLPYNLIVNNIYLRNLKIKELVNQKNISYCIDISDCKSIEKLDNIKCKNLVINIEQIDLVENKENIEFDNICIRTRFINEYSREEFFKKFHNKNKIKRFFQKIFL